MILPLRATTKTLNVLRPLVEVALRLEMKKSTEHNGIKKK